MFFANFPEGFGGLLRTLPVLKLLKTGLLVHLLDLVPVYVVI